MQPSNITHRVPTILTLSFVLMLGFALVAAASQAAAPAKPNSVAEKYGIEVTSVRLSANNHMVDFRYRVLDSRKADTLFTKENRPHLVDQKTGKVLAVPRTAKVGPLMSTYQHKKGRIYWMFFGNPTNLIKSGDPVSVVVGDARIDNLTVE
ncbi:hypothetical protein [Desulfosarcina ovata]|uniref:Uncharacterized protein n=1 Tax=Desulfosarcina ovata subsp. ovata TaxID=2752305 RepID=A0A5K8AM09_9BACT|nr:hypothetical protein [Desulfosarcina ovata]BBO92664.1 hypothetical protein DSCOOX_58440 [Desulfosarcina ovata subsp. ovata]